MGTSGAAAGGGGLDVLTFVQETQDIGTEPIGVSEVAATINFTVPAEYTSYDILARGAVGVQDAGMAVDSSNEISAALFLDGTRMGVSGPSTGSLGINEGDPRGTLHVRAAELGESVTGARTVELKFVGSQADGNRWIYPQIIVTVIPKV